jgi:ethanolamine utilization microcompartment shell protein EutS
VAEVRALLESREMILRGPIRRTIPIASIADLRIEAGALRFRVGDEAIVLELGEDKAARWAKKIATPPPSLAHKLGLGPAAKALVFGAVTDTALIAALAGHRADTAAEAALGLAVVADEAALDRALVDFAASGISGPVWIVHGKGPRASIGDGAVRAHMRAAGFKDNKVSAVSDALSATRYARVKAAG